MFDHLTITENWDGKGLPPIGERVGSNSLHPKGAYEPAIIVSHVPQGGEMVAVFVLENGTDWSWSSFCYDDGRQMSFAPWRELERRSA